MKRSPILTRRQLLARSLTLAAGAALAGFPFHSRADELAAIDVSYAGSMGSLMEGPVKSSVAQSLKLEMHGRAQGSSALAQLIVGGSIRADVFIPVTPGPMLTVLRAGKADIAQPIAHTEMVIAYSPKSRFAAKLQAAAEGKALWWEVLQEPGLRFGRTDPVTDPQGRNIIFTVMLAVKINQQPGLVEKILGPTINEKQIFTEPTVQARLQSGELDAASAYKIQPGPFNLPFITLPKEINLSGQNVHTEHPEISLTLNGKTFQPEPLIYYAAVLKDAPNPNGASAFAKWLRGEQAQAIFRRFNYDPPGGASALRA
ncbi:MAG TPA: extracellular solute-binding protein [Candidatus Angelobacter sp.]|jgi:molybdate/tungstate transport system substrate-binding protein